MKPIMTAKILLHVDVLAHEHVDLHTNVLLAS